MEAMEFVFEKKERGKEKGRERASERVRGRERYMYIIFLGRGGGDWAYDISTSNLARVVTRSSL